ncbi:MAG: energy-coupling factor transporter transmembrane protein EcfT [Chloroflexi bacterium]|nr:energy-coupling factor transporter transmembrane protein EcfT [Chloroflexota bacterium]
MIELSRDITFGQYINNGSPLTRMDPRTKLSCAFLFVVLALYASKFTAFAACLLICIVIQWISRISTLYVLRGFKPFLGFLLFIYIIEILFYYNPGQPQTVIWHWWVLVVSWEAVISSTLSIVRVLFLYYFVSMLMFATSMVDLTDGMEALLAPLQKIGIPVNAFIMVLVVAFKFVPIFVTEVERLIKAQSARGVRFDQGNVFQRTLKLAPLFIPLFVSGFKRAEVLSVAMEARCYGNRPGWRRSKRREMHFERFDALVLAFTVISCIVVVVINIMVPW